MSDKPDYYRRAEMRWMSMEDATIEVPARWLAEEGREHAALLRWADEARELLTGMGPHHPTCDAHWNRPCDCGEEIARLLAALEALGGHQ